MEKWKLSNGYDLYKVTGLRCNTFLLACENGNILIDSGRKNMRRTLIKNIDRVKKIKPGIDFLILTHSHFDHCENAAYLKSVKKCKILLSDKEKEYAMKGNFVIPENIKWIANLVSKFFKKTGRFEPFIPDINLNGNMNLTEFGYDAEIIETPGHSQGSVSIVINNKIAVVGDTLFEVIPYRVCPPFRDDMYQLIKSWEILLNTGCNLFLPSHGFPIKRNLLQLQYDKYLVSWK
jgi:glyoxylase-like metal-dependent hydrolase (beta-lactamase superfamily II)